MDYAWFFWLAFAGGLVWVLARGWRQQFPAWSWAAVLLAAVTLGLVGSKLAVVPPQLWLRALQMHALPQIWAKSWFGGLALASLGLLFLQRREGLPARSLDLLVAPAFLAMAFGRVGCLVGGCCLGTPTSLPWALHRVGGVGVHPVPAYEMIFVLGLLAVLARLPLRAGQRFRLALLLYFAYRFAEGFVRPGQSVLFGLKAQQLTAVVLMLFWLWRFLVDRPERPARNGAVWKPQAALLVLLLLAALFGTFLASPLEQLVLVTSFVLVLGASLLWEATGQTALPASWRPRAIAALVLTLVASGLGARFPAAQDSLPQVEKFWRIGAGGTIGRYQETCGGEHDVTLGAVKVERVLLEPSGTEGYLGVQVYGGMDESSAERLPIFVLNPYLGVDSRWIGFSGGAHVGKVVSDGERKGVLPAFGLRLGPRDVVFAHMSVGEGFPGGTPIPGVCLGLGFGLGQYGQLRFGGSFAGWYAEPRFRFPSGATLVVRGGGGDGEYQFGVGFALPVGRKTR